MLCSSNYRLHHAYSCADHAFIYPFIIITILVLLVPHCLSLFVRQNGTTWLNKGELPVNHCQPPVALVDYQLH